MSLDIQFLDEHSYLQEKELEQLRAVLTTAAELEQIKEAEVSVTFVTDQEIRELNKEYRDIDSATDVLSFPMYEAEEDNLIVDDEEELVMLGDIIISIDRAKEQATEYGHSYLRELGFLAVHGFLHLLGYDHETEADEQKMFARQEEILAKHGLVR